MTRLPRISTADAAVERIDTGDHAEVVYDLNFEQHVIRVQNKVWAEEPRFVAFVGHEPEREIRDLITALETLLRVTS
jgi:hypothetical protein